VESHGHYDHYLPWPAAVEEAKEQLRICINQLELTRLRKNADMESYMRNNIVLIEIEMRLKEINNLINQKIEEFKQEINKIYAEHVKEKLEDLDDIMKKSKKNLEKELSLLKEKPGKSLARFYTRDLLHDIKYFDSYFNEIFIKKTRNFRTGLQNDRILTLIVTFQQNLKKIFTFNADKNTVQDHRQFHLFREEETETALYTLTKDYQKVECKRLPALAPLISFP
jgi:hypothetical protein